MPMVERVVADKPDSDAEKEITRAYFGREMGKAKAASMLARIVHSRIQADLYAEEEKNEPFIRVGHHIETLHSGYAVARTTAEMLVSGCGLGIGFTSSCFAVGIASDHGIGAAHDNSLNLDVARRFWYRTLGSQRLKLSLGVALPKDYGNLAAELRIDDLKKTALFVAQQAIIQFRSLPKPSGVAKYLIINGGITFPRDINPMFHPICPK
jgi:hypothetical protein